MALTTLARVVTGCQQKQNGKQKKQLGVLTTQPVLLPRRLNCPWQATAATAMVRSAMWVPSASIGLVPWMVPTRGTCTSAAAMPAWAAATGRSATLCVALRIDLSREISFISLGHFEKRSDLTILTLKLPVPPFRRTGSFYNTRFAGRILLGMSVISSLLEYCRMTTQNHASNFCEKREQS